MDRLPLLLAVRVLGFSCGDARDVVAVMCTCARLRVIASMDSVWAAAFVGRNVRASLSVRVLCDADLLLPRLTVETGVS